MSQNKPRQVTKHSQTRLFFSDSAWKTSTFQFQPQNKPKKRPNWFQLGFLSFNSKINVCLWHKRRTMKHFFASYDKKMRNTYLHASNTQSTFMEKTPDKKDSPCCLQHKKCFLGKITTSDDWNKRVLVISIFWNVSIWIFTKLDSKK